MSIREPYTTAKFERVATRPENTEKRLGFISGGIIERVSNDIASYMATRLTDFITAYLMTTNNIGRVMVANGGFMAGANAISLTFPSSRTKITRNSPAWCTAPGVDVLPGFTLAMADIFKK